jgi:hypothetical protein
MAEDKLKPGDEKIVIGGARICRIVLAIDCESFHSRYEYCPGRNCILEPFALIILWPTYEKVRVILDAIQLKAH